MFNQNMNQGTYNPNMQNMNQGTYNPNMQNMNQGTYNINMQNMNQGTYNPNKQNMNQGTYNINMQNMNQGTYNPNMQNMNQGTYNPNMQNMNQGTYNINMQNMNQGTYNPNMQNMNQGTYNQNMYQPIYNQNMQNMNFYQPLYNQNMNQMNIPRSRSHNANFVSKFRANNNNRFNFSNINNLYSNNNNIGYYNQSSNLHNYNISNNIYNQNSNNNINTNNNINNINPTTTILKKVPKREKRIIKENQIKKIQENTNDINNKGRNDYKKRGTIQDSQKNKEKIEEVKSNTINKNNNKNDTKSENLNNDNQNNKKENCTDKKEELGQKKEKEEKPSKDYDLKLNGLIKARGLENVGATCYMNSTLQCLYHVKQLSEALVNDSKIDKKLELTYSFKNLIEKLAFYDLKKYRIDRQYNNITGENIKSIKPEDFKEVLSKKNPLFKGIKANDSKDLIMYLFQEMDKELTLRNNNTETMKMFIGNNESDVEKENFKEYHNSIFGDLFYGFQRSEMICYTCKEGNSTYNVFNNLILPIEKTYNSLNEENKNKNKIRNRNNNVYNIFNPQTCQTFNRKPELSLSVNYNYVNNNYNNFNSTPDLPKKLTLYDCLKEMLKDEILSGENQIYCNKCRNMRNSINRTTLYKTPNILVLILNRGKGNSFECEIEFSSNEILDLSRYNIISPDSPKKYNLFGVISHIGESSDEGHFIAYCKHFDDNWYMFNDSIAKTVGEDELTNGVPYILFYRNIDIDKEF